MRQIYSGLFFSLLALAMLGNSLNGLVAGEAFFLARHGGWVVIAHAAQPSLFRAVVAFCAVGGCITALFVRHLVLDTD